MNTTILKGLLKVAPFGITAFSLFFAVHGLHMVRSGDPLGPGGPDGNVHVISGGDPLGPGGPDGS